MPFLVAWGRCRGNLCVLLNLFQNARSLVFYCQFLSFFFFLHFEQSEKTHSALTSGAFLFPLDCEDSFFVQKEKCVRKWPKETENVIMAKWPAEVLASE